jgi:hypothetical protein
MVLVPRQLKRTGMTGNVPYYGGGSRRLRRMRPNTPEPSGHRNRRPLKRALWPPEVGRARAGQSSSTR